MVLAPEIPVFRVMQNIDTNKVAAIAADASILVYLIEEFVRLGAVSVAVDTDRYVTAVQMRRNAW
jgi:hypothetical protein